MNKKPPPLWLRLLVGWALVFWMQNQNIKLSPISLGIGLTFMAYLNATDPKRNN